VRLGRRWWLRFLSVRSFGLREQPGYVHKDPVDFLVGKLAATVGVAGFDVGARRGGYSQSSGTFSPVLYAGTRGAAGTIGFAPRVEARAAAASIKLAAIMVSRVGMAIVTRELMKRMA
jgi:hypothetical protein